MDILVSVIIPVYNTSAFLKKCFDSLAQQDYENIEIIIVNDGSTDNSENICLDFASVDKRVKYLFQENEGLSSARNAGLEVASGEYISFVDSDDYVEKSFISTLLFACLDNNSKISMCGRKIISESGEKHLFTSNRIQVWTSYKAVERLLLWKGIDGACCDKIFHHSLFISHSFPVGRISEDLPITVNHIIRTEKVIHVGKALYNYCRRDGSITRSPFTVNKMSILISSNEVKNLVLNKYPGLKTKAEYYHLMHLLHLRVLIIGNVNTHEKYFNEIKKEIKNQFFSIILSPYLPINQKIKLITIKAKISVKEFMLRVQ